MDLYKRILSLKTKTELELIDITDKIKKVVEKSKIKEGFVQVYSKHTTLGIKINEYEPQLLKDITQFFDTLVPQERDYHHDKFEFRTNIPPNEPKNAHSHLRTLLMETSQTIPISNYKIDFGVYQSVIAIETSGPRKRELVVSVYGIK